MQRSSVGCSVDKKGAMGGARGGEYYILTPRWYSGKICAPGGPSSVLQGRILFLEVVNFYFLRGGKMNKKQLNFVC